MIIPDMFTIQPLIRSTRQHSGIILILVAYGLIICLTFREYGITNDEPIHIEYGEALVEWYATLGQDDRVLSLDRTYLYGGFFDTVGRLAALASPFDPYETKHLCNAFVGLIGIVAAYRLGVLLGGKRAGLLAAITLILTPRYYGHAFNNPKDIPFAVFYLWSVYFLTRSIGTFPRLPLKLAVWTGISIGLTLAIRIGGILLFGYLALFFSIAWLTLARKDRLGEDVGPPIVSLISIGAIAGAVMLLFWPLAQVHPFTTLSEALTRFSNFPEMHWSYFDGRYISSIETPRTYLPQWLLITLPELVFLGLGVGSIIVLSSGRWRHWHRRRGLQVTLVALAGLFPIGYAVVLKPSLYDGMRHFLFALPPLSVLSGVSIAKGLEIFKRRAAVTLSIAATVCGGLVAGEMVRLHPNQIVYFNQLFAGGVDTAWKRYETDYWRHAQKQALGWISRTYTSEYDRTIRVASRFTGIRHQMPEKLQLVDFRSSPDFYVGSTRYDEHRVIPGEVLHIIRAGRDAELAYVVRPDDSYVNEPFFTNSTFADVHRRPIYLREAECLESRGDRLGAARAYLKLSRCCERLSLKLLDQGMAPAGYAKKALGYQIKAISLIPSAEDAEKIANRYLEKGDYPGARDILQGLTATYPGQFRYVEKLIRTLAQTGEYDHALERCERWIRKDPKSLSPKLLRVTVSIASGDLDRAEGYLEEAERVSPGSEDVKTVRAALERAVQGASDLD